MEWLRELRRRLPVLLRGDRIHRELEEEMQFHLEMQAEENREGGMGADEARHAAQRQFGNPTLLAGQGRAAWGWTTVEGVLRGLRHALRMMRRTPGLTAAMVLTLALGIGANTAIFSLTHALLLRSLPVPHPGELRTLSQRTPQGQRAAFSLAAATAFAAAGSVQAAAAYATPGPALFGGRGGALETLHREQASAAYVATLGVYPVAGRWFTPEEDRKPSGAVVISHAYWKRRFNAEPAAIGARIRARRGRAGLHGGRRGVHRPDFRPSAGLPGGSCRCGTGAHGFPAVPLSLGFRSGGAHREPSERAARLAAADHPAGSAHRTDQGVAGRVNGAARRGHLFTGVLSQAITANRYHSLWGGLSSGLKPARRLAGGQDWPSHRVGRCLAGTGHQPGPGFPVSTHAVYSFTAGAPPS